MRVIWMMLPLAAPACRPMLMHVHKQESVLSGEIIQMDNVVSRWLRKTIKIRQPLYDVAYWLLTFLFHPLQTSHARNPRFIMPAVHKLNQPVMPGMYNAVVVQWVGITVRKSLSAIETFLNISAGTISNSSRLKMSSASWEIYNWRDAIALLVPLWWVPAQTTVSPAVVRMVK